MLPTLAVGCDLLEIQASELPLVMFVLLSVRASLFTVRSVIQKLAFGYDSVIRGFIAQNNGVTTYYVVGFGWCLGLSSLQFRSRWIRVGPHVAGVLRV